MKPYQAAERPISSQAAAQPMGNCQASATDVAHAAVAAQARTSQAPVRLTGGCTRIRAARIA